MPEHLRVFVALVIISSAADVKIKKNWQDLWRGDLNKCVADNAKLFKDAFGKPRTRKLGEMTRLISDDIAGKISKDSKDSKVNSPSPTSAKPAKLSKKERMKQELKQQLNGDLRTVFQDMESAKDKTAYYQRIREQGEQMILQMSRQSKLPFDTDLTLREWCDLVWRSGRFSPLDQDKPKKVDDSDIFDLQDAEDAEESHTKASHPKEL